MHRVRPALAEEYLGGPVVTADPNGPVPSDDSDERAAQAERARLQDNLEAERRRAEAHDEAERQRLLDNAAAEQRRLDEQQQAPGP